MTETQKLILKRLDELLTEWIQQGVDTNKHDDAGNAIRRPIGPEEAEVILDRVRWGRGGRG